MRKHRTVWRRLAVAGLLVVIGAGLELVFLAGTVRGRNWLAAGLSRALSANGREVHVEGLSLSWPAQVALARVAVADPRGPWLDIRALDCRWTWTSLLARPIVIQSVRAESLEIARWPVSEKTDSAPAAGFKLPDFHVADVECVRVWLGADACGQPLEIRQMNGQLTGAGTNNAANLQFQARAQNLSYGAVTGRSVAVDGGISIGASRWDLAGVLAAEGLRISSGLGFAKSDPWPTGRLQAEFDAASGLASSPWPDLETGKFEFSWDCPTRQDGRQEGRVQFSAAEVKSGNSSLQHAVATGTLSRTSGLAGFQIEGRARLGTYALGSLSMTGAEIRVAGPWQDLEWSLAAEGVFAQPFYWDVAGRLKWNEAEPELELSHGEAGWGVGYARLTEPLGVRMKAGDASIRGAANLETLDLSALIHPAIPPMRGTITGSMRIAGTLAAPEIRVDVAGRGIQAQGGVWASLPPAEGRGRVSVSNGFFKLAVQTEIATNGHLKAEAEAPLWLSLDPWKWELASGLPLSANLHADMDLSPAGRAAGRVQAELHVAGTPVAPRFDGWAASTAMVVRTGPRTVLPAVAGRVEVSGSNGLLQVSGDVRMAGGIAQAGGTARIPCRLSLAPWHASLDRDGDFPAKLRSHLDLAMLNAFDWAANSQLGGRVDFAMTHQGSLSDGTVTGTCTLAGGSYENYAWGTVIREAGLHLASQGNQWVVESGGATDGGGGRVALTGHLRPDPATGLPFELALEFRRMQLLRRPDVEAAVSGKLTLAGNWSRLRADGDFQLDNALVDLRNLRPPRPVQLETPPNTEPVAVAPQAGRNPLELHLGIGIPGTLYIRGRTLDSAWSGQFELERKGGLPRLVGHLEPRRGNVLLLQRPFKLDTGRVDFDGRWPPLPVLRLEAVFNRADLQARAAVTGPATDPDISLTSVPPLPEDEIIARILFGEDVAGLTPLQAVSLAAEVSKLGNLGGGSGVLGELQAATGIDRVELRETGSDTAQTEVAVGKYIGDRSYVEMRRATAVDSSERARLYLEHEVRPNIVLEAESGLEMRSGLGLFWKRDY